MNARTVAAMPRKPIEWNAANEDKAGNPNKAEH